MHLKEGPCVWGWGGATGQQEAGAGGRASVSRITEQREALRLQAGFVISSHVKKELIQGQLGVALLSPHSPPLLPDSTSKAPLALGPSSQGPPLGYMNVLNE